MDKIAFNKMNEYLVNKKELICVEDPDKNDSFHVVDSKIVLGMAANLDRWGYALSEECIKKLCELSEENVVEIYNELINILKVIKGDDVDHDTLLFKNFPDSCRNMSAEELSDIRFISYYAAFIDQIFGTNLYNEIEWDGEVLERTSDVKHDNLRVIGLASKENFKQMIKDMLSARMSLSDYDKEIIDFGIENFNSAEIIPSEIPFKENWAYIIKKAVNGEVEYDFTFKAVTDFVRVCVALSDGDLSLATKPKFRTFTNQERKLLLSKLNQAAENCKEIFVESLCSRRNKRLFYNIVLKGWHTDLKNAKYRALGEAWTEACEKYSKLSRAEQAIEKKDYLTAAKEYMSAGEGYLVRHANFLMDKVGEEDVTELAAIIKKAALVTAPAVLLNAKAALSAPEFKVAFIKGCMSKVYAYNNERKMDAGRVNMLSEIYDSAIIEQLKEKPSLGTIYIDEALKDCPMPFAQRANNGKNRAVERGTRLNSNREKPVIRGFVYKKYYLNGFYDISASFLDDTFSLIEQVSWTQLKVSGVSRPISVHSGDNPNCANGCTEFIDIDKRALKEYNEKDSRIRYLAFQVYAWSGVPFCNMERCFFGVMERDDMASDKITDGDKKRLMAAGVDLHSLNNNHDSVYYCNLNAEQLKIVKNYYPEVVFDPATVEYRYDLTGDALAKVTMMYDIKEEQFIFTDLNISGKGGKPFKRNIKNEVPATVKLSNINLYNGSETPLLENYVGQTALVCHAVVDTIKPSIYEFLKMYAKATDTKIVSDKNAEVDVIFTANKTGGSNEVTPFDIEILANLMTV